MKRSAQIGLLVMGALTTTSAAGYFANNHDRACQQRALDNPQGTRPEDCRRSVWYGSGHGSGGSHSFFGSSSSSGTSAGSGHSSSGTSSAAFGGFGGHAGHGGGSGT